MLSVEFHEALGPGVEFVVGVGLDFLEKDLGLVFVGEELLVVEGGAGGRDLVVGGEEGGRGGGGGEDGFVVVEDLFGVGYFGGFEAVEALLLLGGGRVGGRSGGFGGFGTG